MPRGNASKDRRRIRKGERVKNKKHIPQGMCRFCLFAYLSGALDFVALEATGADVSGLDFAVLYDLDLLNVRLERPSRLAIAVANVVSAALTFVADTAYSRHIDTSAVVVLWSGVKSAPLGDEHRYDTKTAKKNQTILCPFPHFFGKNKKNRRYVKISLAKRGKIV